MPNENDKLATTKQSTLAQYGSFDLEEMQDAAKDLPTGSTNYFEPRQGKNVVRFMPPPVGKKATKIWYKHWFEMGGERKQVICTKFQFNQPCPICDKGAKLRSTGNKVDAKKARAFEPQSAVYANIVDMVDPEKGVQLWRISPGLFKDIMAAIDNAGVGKTFAHPEKGFNIVFTRTGESKKTKYKGHTVQREASELPGWQELLPQQMDLETVEQAPSDEEQDEALDGKYEAREYGGKKKGAKGAADKEDPDYDGEEDAELVDDDEDVPH